MELLASIAGDETEAYGSSRVMGVPAERVESLRRSIRKTLRGRGFRSQTHHLDGVVYVVSDDASAVDPDGALPRDRDAADLVARSVVGDSPSDRFGLPPDAVVWSGWVVEF